MSAARLQFLCQMLVTIYDKVKGKAGGGVREALKKSQQGKGERNTRITGSHYRKVDEGRDHGITAASSEQQLIFYISSHREMKTTLRLVHSFQGQPYSQDRSLLSSVASGISLLNSGCVLILQYHLNCRFNIPPVTHLIKVCSTSWYSSAYFIPPVLLTKTLHWATEILFWYPVLLRTCSSHNAFPSEHLVPEPKCLPNFSLCHWLTININTFGISKTLMWFSFLSISENCLTLVAFCVHHSFTWKHASDLQGQASASSCVTSVQIKERCPFLACHLGKSYPCGPVQCQKKKA